jgi:hypothetical protein
MQFLLLIFLLFGSIVGLFRDSTLCPRLAQLVEHSTDTRKVLGSTPKARTEGLIVPAQYKVA